MSEHTPGPWRVSDIYAPALTVIAPDGFPVAGASDTAVLERWGVLHPDVDHWSHAEGRTYVERSEAEAEANARLMAAAPDLLIAARDALTRMEQVAELLNGGAPSAEDVERAYNLVYPGALRTAIRKATGSGVSA